MTIKLQLLQLGQRPRQVLHQRHGYVLQRTGGRLGERAVERRAVPARHDHARRAEHRRRAQDGTDIVRVGHLVEHHDRPAGGTVGQLAQVGLRQRLGLEQRTLVHGVGAEAPVEVRGSARSCVTCRAASAGRRRISALSVRHSRRTLRCGLASAASTAWMPKINVCRSSRRPCDAASADDGDGGRACASGSLFGRPREAGASAELALPHLPVCG